MFKELGDLAQVIKQAGQMGSKMKEVTAELKGKRITASSGGGLIQVEANGLGEILSLKIDPTLQGDLEMIEDLVPAAMNQIALKAKELNLEMVQSLTGGLSLPGMESLFGGTEKK
jgi:nucleoid-associated protein EbfC